MHAQKISLCLIVALAAVVDAATVYLAGDSTMANNGHGGGTVGWGLYLYQHLRLPVSNHAIGGRSVVSFTGEGRFRAIAASLRPGDYVIAEFGHNDAFESAGTFQNYMVAAANLMKSKGANVIISSQTPDNVWEGGRFAFRPSRFAYAARSAAAAAGVPFVDHGLFMASAFKNLGPRIVNSYYRPGDHTHTNAAGAQAVARAFVNALRASGSPLKNYISG